MEKMIERYIWVYRFYFGKIQAQQEVYPCWVHNQLNREIIEQDWDSVGSVVFSIENSHNTGGHPYFQILGSNWDEVRILAYKNGSFKDKIKIMLELLLDGCYHWAWCIKLAFQEGWKATFSRIKYIRSGQFRKFRV